MDIDIRAVLAAALPSSLLGGIDYRFANRPFAALFIDGGYHIGQFVLFTLILGLWH